MPAVRQRRRLASYASVAACLAGVALAGAGVVRTVRPVEVAASVPLVADASYEPLTFPHPPPPPTAPAASLTPSRRPAPVPAVPAVPLVPATLAVPAAGVRSTLEGLHLDSRGELGVPRDYDLAGWWATGPRPGAGGAPAVFVGHVDSTRGPAVFHQLPGVRPGDEVLVADAAGRSLRFVVHRVERYPKSRFPTARVYGATAVPEVRLVTCGGTFDERTRHYRDNVVVYARLAT